MSDYANKYCYPGTDVLRNSLNIRDPKLLEQAERFTSGTVMSHGQSEYLRPTIAGIKDAHYDMLHKLYPNFAGQFRAVNMGKVDERGREIPFLNGDKVAGEMERLIGTASREIRQIGGRADLGQFADRAANYIAQLNRIHPFPEGNGRIQRLFLQTIGNRLGYRINLPKIERAAWVEASIDSFRQGEGDPHAKMRAVIEKATSRHRTGQLDREDKLEELRERYREAGTQRPFSQRPGSGQKL